MACPPIPPPPASPNIATMWDFAHNGSLQLLAVMMIMYIIAFFLIGQRRIRKIASKRQQTIYRSILITGFVICSIVDYIQFGLIFPWRDATLAWPAIKIGCGYVSDNQIQIREHLYAVSSSVANIFSTIGFFVGAMFVLMNLNLLFRYSLNFFPERTPRHAEPTRAISLIARRRRATRRRQ